MKGRLLCIFAFITLLGSLILLWKLDPSHSRHFPPCPFHYLTGLYCPGCGTLRAMHSLLNGKILQALSFNLLSMLALPVIAWTLFAKWINCVFKVKIWTPKPSPWFSKAVLITVIVFWILRNIPVEPFSWLAP